MAGPNCSSGLGRPLNNAERAWLGMPPIGGWPKTRFHVRRLPKGHNTSAEARELAEKAGITLTRRKTFVRGYERVGYPWQKKRQQKKGV